MGRQLFSTKYEEQRRNFHMYDFITGEHKMIQEMARSFAQKSIAPIADEIDRTGEFPMETVRQMGELGLMGIEAPEEYGGAEMDTLAYALALIEISKVSFDSR